MKTVSAASAGFLLHHNDKLVLIDVRSDAEFDSLHVPGSRSMPLTRVDLGVVRKLAAEGGDFYVLCESGYRSRLVIDRLESEGIDNAVLVEGGIVQWLKAGLPVVRRQVTRQPLHRAALAVLGGWLRPRARAA